eukprot:4610587-Pyramimonas_sp.AAC.1
MFYRKELEDCIPPTSPNIQEGANVKFFLTTLKLGARPSAAPTRLGAATHLPVVVEPPREEPPLRGDRQGVIAACRNGGHVVPGERLHHLR